jgi:hypothetical protein
LFGGTGADGGLMITALQRPFSPMAVTDLRSRPRKWCMG